MHLNMLLYDYMSSTVADTFDKTQYKMLFAGKIKHKPTNA